MKSFLQLTEEQSKKLALLFGRMNPPTRGHEENVEGLKKMAKAHGADHLVIASHSHDAKKNPLSPDVKLKHLKRSFPDTNITTSSKSAPTILHHAAEAHKKGYSHLIIAGGGDRVEEYKKLLHHYNGKEGRHGFYNFKKIEVKSTGERKQGISGTDMRNHAQNNDFASFHKNLSSHMQKNPAHAKELFKDVRKGMGLHESKDHGMFKAIFVSGGPGSGKDIIIREAIAHQNAVEINATLAASILADKHKLSEQSRDVRREAVRNRMPLIINGTTAERENISYIKEELEELGYETMMVFVNTTNDSSKKRNEGHERMMAESVRQERWEAAQKISEAFNESFSKYLEFDNSLDLNEADQFQIAQKEEDISIIYEMTNWFFELLVDNEIADDWLLGNNKGGVLDKVFEQMVNRTQNTPMTAYGKRNREGTIQKEIQNLRKKKQQQNAEIQKSIETLRNRMRFEEKEDVSETSKTIHAEGQDCSCGDKTTSVGRSDKKGDTYKRLRLLDNICPACQLTAKAGRPDDVRDGDIASNTKYTFRTYHEATGQTIEIKPEPKETRFQQDNDKIKAKRQKTSPAEAGKVLKAAGISPEFDTRGSGTVYPMSGLGNVTYREQTENKYGSTAEVTRKSFTRFRESIDSPSAEMGVTGGYHGATNKEPIESELEKTANQTSNKKKKK